MVISLYHPKRIHIHWVYLWNYKRVIFRPCYSVNYPFPYVRYSYGCYNRGGGFGNFCGVHRDWEGFEKGVSLFGYS